MRDPRAGAEVRADAERHVAVPSVAVGPGSVVAGSQDLAGVEIVAEDVEAFGIGEDPVVVVGRHVDHVDQRTRGDRHAVQLDVERVVAGLAPDRRRVAQHLVERRGPQGRVGLDRRELVGVLQQQVPEVHDRAASRLAAAAHDQCDERRDLLGRHDVTVDLGRAQLGDDVETDLVAGFVVEVRRRRPPFLDERLDVLLQVLPGHQAVVVGVAAAETRHHGVVPPRELLAGVLGDAEHLGDDTDRELVGEARAELDQGGARRAVDLDTAGRSAVARFFGLSGSHHSAISSSAISRSACSRLVSAAPTRWRP